MRISLKNLRQRYELNRGRLFRKHSCGAKSGSEVKTFVIRYRGASLKKYEAIWMLINGKNIPASKMLDHKDRNRSNSRMRNLRVASKSQNNANRGVWGKIPYNGVHLNSRGTRYIAQCHGAKGSNKRIGQYKTAEEAARAYDAVAKKRFGEFATLNFN